MAAPKNFTMPAQGTASRMAAEYLFKNGPATELEILMAVDFGCDRAKREEKLQRSIGAGVLTQRADDKLDCSAEAKAFFEKLAGDQGETKPIGEIKPAPTLPQYRGDWRASSGLSKRNIPNSRGTRLDIPEWSIRDRVTFHTKA